MGRQYGRLVIGLLLFSYLLSNRVLRSFGLDATSRFRFKSAALILAASLAALATTALLSTLIISTYGRSVPWIQHPDSVEHLLKN